MLGYCDRFLDAFLPQERFQSDVLQAKRERTSSLNKLSPLSSTSTSSATSLTISIGGSGSSGATGKDSKEGGGKTELSSPGRSKDRSDDRSLLFVYCT